MLITAKVQRIFSYINKTINFVTRNANHTFLEYYLASPRCR